MCPKKQSTKDNKRIRRVLPEQMIYIGGKPTNNDVVGGRGGRSNNHPGNKLYLKIILANKTEYDECKTIAAAAERIAAGTAVAQRVVDSIQSEGGRFVQKQEGNSGRWFVMPERIVMKKVKQCLRDPHIPEWFVLDPECFEFEVENLTF